MNGFLFVILRCKYTNYLLCVQMFTYFILNNLHKLLKVLLYDWNIIRNAAVFFIPALDL